jgi:hypothetical protein
VYLSNFYCIVCRTLGLSLRDVCETCACWCDGRCVCGVHQNQSGARSCEDFLHFMNERAKLEDSYAKALNKLSRHGARWKK